MGAQGLATICVVRPMPYRRGTQRLFPKAKLRESVDKKANVPIGFLEL